MIIALTGSMGSGKDTVAHMLIQHHNFVRFSFAGTLKDCVSSVFGWCRADLEGTDAASRQWRETVDTWWAQRLGIENLTPRWVLQHLGTDVMRNHFHPDIWVASLQRQLADTKQHVVISDTRFANEAHMITKLGGQVWQVQRGPQPPWWSLAVTASSSENPHSSQAASVLQSLGVHASEWSWACVPADHTLLNNGTLEQLRQQVDQALIGK